jgi:hypothetical protein
MACVYDMKSNGVGTSVNHSHEQPSPPPSLSFPQTWCLLCPCFHIFSNNFVIVDTDNGGKMCLLLNNILFRFAYFLAHKNLATIFAFF